MKSLHWDHIPLPGEPPRPITLPVPITWQDYLNNVKATSAYTAPQPPRPQVISWEQFATVAILCALYTVLAMLVGAALVVWWPFV